jgi:protein disulfide-isomerase
MPRLFMVFCCFALGCLSCQRSSGEAREAAPKTADGSAWASLSLESALREAGQRETVVFVELFAEWCEPCHEMERTVFREPTVLAQLSRAVSVQRDGEKGEGAQLCEQFRVMGFPTFLLLRPDGTELARYTGSTDAAGLLAFLAPHLGAPK